MGRVYNFASGPSVLPLAALESAAAELVEYQGKGMSLLEMSHRGKEYMAVHASAIQLTKEILGVPDNFKILFLGGGATMQFAMAPMNLLGAGKSCDFTLTGQWAKKACEDAKKSGKVNVLFDGKANNYMSLPNPATLKISSDATYLHMTSNETIGGIQWPTWPETGQVPIVADMSSDIMSRRLPMEKFGLIYAGAQKNLGPAGVALVIIRQDVLEKCADNLPAYLSYKIHAENDSLYNTPPVFCVYMIEKTLKWLKDLGGLPAAEKLAAERAEIVYAAIDQSNGFYRCPVDPAVRSKMNIVWCLGSEDLEKKFLAEAAKVGLVNLSGHRSVGGCRASLYNAMPVEGARRLSEFMGAFAGKNG
jgi:phosphoserine aminotransferase